MTKAAAMTPLERAARALTTCEKWSSFWSEDDARVLVRAVVAAIRSPSAAMIEAAAVAHIANDTATDVAIIQKAAESARTMPCVANTTPSARNVHCDHCFWIAEKANAKAALTASLDALLKETGDG